MTSTLADHTDPVLGEITTISSPAVIAGRLELEAAKQREVQTRAAANRAQEAAAALRSQIEADQAADLERRVEAEIAGLTAPVPNVALERKLSSLETTEEVAGRVEAAWASACNAVPRAATKLMAAILEEHATNDLPKLEHALERVIGGLAELAKLTGSDFDAFRQRLAPMLHLTPTLHCANRDMERVRAEADGAQVYTVIDRQREARAAAGWPTLAQIEARARSAAEALRTT